MQAKRRDAASRFDVPEQLPAAYRVLTPLCPVGTAGAPEAVRHRDVPYAENAARCGVPESGLCSLSNREGARQTSLSARPKKSPALRGFFLVWRWRQSPAN